MGGKISHIVKLGADVYGNITRMDNLVDGLEKKLNSFLTMLQDTQNQLANARMEMKVPFAREKELEEKSSRLKELNILLHMEQKGHVLLDDSPEKDTLNKAKQREYMR